jgi:hypothetical protein
MPKDDLRSALRAIAEPTEPPSGARDGILGEIARRRRNRLRATTLLGAGATLALIGAVGWAVSRSDDRGTDPAPPADRPTITEPFEAPPCPDRLPELDPANTRVPDLTGAQSVRLCEDPSDWDLVRDPPTAAELASSLGPEALVRDLDEFARDVGAIPAADPDRCETVHSVQSRDSLVIRYARETVIVPVAGCSDLHVDGRVVDAPMLRYAFIEALDRQRDRFTYTRRVEAALTCRTFGSGGPSKPGRERLLEAVRCDPTKAGTGREAMPLSEEGVRRLQDAWTRAQPYRQAAPVDRQDGCTRVEHLPSEILARTDRGDVVRFFDSPCGYLVSIENYPGDDFLVPVTLDELS